jgi:hypothetical protein
MLASRSLFARERNARGVGFEERELFVDNLLDRIHFIIEMIWWTGLASREFEFPFPGRLTSTSLGLASTGRETD